ncbi:MAG: hypothetical protein NT069_24100 [Planctomycetota bacterium]|nr:hypothetical protein [Planctomycetota bacterium]
MRNITGSIVAGDDYFSRPAVERRLKEHLAYDHCRIMAPRRFGKSSFVGEVARQLRADGWLTVEFNVEGQVDEQAFWKELISRLGLIGFNLPLTQRIVETLKSSFPTMSGKLNLPGAELELNTAATDPVHTREQSNLNRLFHQVKQAPNPVLIALDEFPSLLLRLEQLGHGKQRVKDFLHWFRVVQQEFQPRLRWLVYGSVGLDSFAERNGLSAQINQLAPFSLGSFSPAEAHEFLIRLGIDNNLPVDEAVRQEILDRVGWPLPYFLQLVFHALKSLDLHPIGVSHVRQAIEKLCHPNSNSLFSTWHERLQDQFVDEDRTLVLDILKQLCEVPRGLRRQEIHKRLMARRAGADPDKLDENARRLLDVLVRDGYLSESDGQYAFLSFLLRSYWQRRHGE